MSTKPIPDGFRTVTPHLTVRGAADAIAFYKKAFGASEMIRSPMPGSETKLIHASIRIGDSVVMLVDEFPEMQCLSPASIGGSPVTIHLYVPDVDASIAKAEAAGAKVTMPAMDAFWGDRYGQIVDPFGHKWSLATHLRDVSPEEAKKAAAAAFAQHR
jgi:PhnB protein